jgi:hypothetical protein
MNEAGLTMKAAADPRQAAPLHWEPVIYELTGSAFAAAALLHAIAADDGLANSKSVPPGLDWLARKLSGAAENLNALFEGRDPQWETLDDLQQIAAALGKAKAAEARRTTGWSPHV